MWALTGHGCNSHLFSHFIIFMVGPVYVCDIYYFLVHLSKSSHLIRLFEYWCSQSICQLIICCYSLLFLLSFGIVQIHPSHLISLFFCCNETRSERSSCSMLVRPFGGQAGNTIELYYTFLALKTWTVCLTDLCVLYNTTTASAWQYACRGTCNEWLMRVHFTGICRLEARLSLRRVAISHCHWL